MGIRILFSALFLLQFACSNDSPTRLESSSAILVQEALSREGRNEHATEQWIQASELGNETAQYVVGVMHAFGLNGFVKDDSKALLHFYFSALGGHIPAQMALAYRHNRGDGVPLSCKTASMYIELAANNLMDEFTRLDLVEPGFTAERLTAPDDVSTPEVKYGDTDLVDYYFSLASKGDNQARNALGKIFYFGAKEVERDIERAYKLLLKASQEGDVPSTVSLAHLLLKRGEARYAFGNFSKAAESGNAAAFNGLGYMHLMGVPVLQLPSNPVKALMYFKKASDAHVMEANYNLGVMYASQEFSPTVDRDFIKAFRYFSLAAQKGSVQALHKLAHMNLHGLGIASPSCKVAVQYFKAVSERTLFALTSKRDFQLAYSTVNTNPQLALEMYLRLSEMGYEVGETNAARIVDKLTSLNEATRSNSLLSALHRGLDLLGVSHPPALGHGTERALHLYERAAEQGSIRARLRVGDFWYYGGENVHRDFSEAANHYRVASGEGASAQAHFNLGYQYHYGLGLVQDTHLARRYYDMALAASSDSKMAVYLALGCMWLENLHKSWSGENFVTTPSSSIPVDVDVDTSRWMDWFNFVNSLNFDSIVIGILCAAFFMIGLYKDRRLQRIRQQQGV